MRQRSIALRDGRSLAWTEWGREDGTPVVFCTGAGMSGSLGFGIESLDELGMRLIAIDRPGLGRSSADPAKSFDSWTDDVRELGLGACAAVGFSQGAPFALALAAAGVAGAVAVVSGQDELAHPSMRPVLVPDVLRMVEAVERDPAGFEREFARFATAAGLRDLIMAMSSRRDLELYSRPEFSAAFTRCLEEGFAQGAAGYARDLVLALGRWPFRVEEIGVPVELWYGGLDTSSVHSPDFGETLARRLPVSRRAFDAHEGGSILWTRSFDILAALSR